jgi:signal transduction histidine kinase
VKALAGLHGGSLSLQSRPWEGTTATVRLPIAAADPAQQELDCLG